MKNLGDGIRELSELMKITKKNQIEDKHKLTSVNKTVTIICQKIDGIKQDCPENNE